MWEKAIELGKQLAKMHESHMFDFMELSQLLVRGHVQFNSAVNRITQKPARTAASLIDVSLNVHECVV